MKRELLIGCGRKHDKRLTADGSWTFDNPTTLDYNQDHKTDVVWDLHNLPLPFEAEYFDEIHAYEVLEHVGQQGDYKTFFAQFTEFYRILKPGGYFMATCPSRHSRWAWGDPSHTRILQKEQLHFLNQQNYIDEVGKTSISDFRPIYKADFATHWVEEGQEHFKFILKKI
jgi:cyclopropane fatty-acyl-phospholipid synthase-like methyltransferase